MLVTKQLFLLLMILVAGQTLAEENYQSPEDFLTEAFDGAVPSPAVVWLQGDIKQSIADILGHDYPGLRLRYWGKGTRTAWILEEIGKVKPITVGLVVENNAIDTIRVLAFRESRGWEVRYPFFTDQFNGVRLEDDLQLNRTIDGISGATLSVRALKKLARMALYLHTQTPFGNDPAP